MAELLDIFGNYCRKSDWYAERSDIRNEVYQRYEAAISPGKCRKGEIQCVDG